MSVVRMGATKQYSENWENIFSGGRSSSGKSATQAKPGRKSPKKVARAAAKSAGKKKAAGRKAKRK
jgi:hypothetical protein